MKFTTYKIKLNDGTPVVIRSESAAAAIETARQIFPSHTIVKCHSGQTKGEARIRGGAWAGLIRYEILPHKSVNDTVTPIPQVIVQISFPFESSAIHASEVALEMA